MKYSKIADLREIFLENNGKAHSGKSIIDFYIDKDKNLKYLLRYHSEGTITNKETWLRDNVDYFLEYFSILGLAHVTGFLSLSELQESKDEILHYLNIRPVKKYFYENYPLILPQVVLEAIENNVSFLAGSYSSIQRQRYFFQFHALNQSIDNEDVNQFLWFLDNGISNGYDIDDLKNILKDTQLCFDTRKKKNPLGQSIRGFFMYLDFIQQFDLFLSRQKNPLDRSAYWMYHAYWLKRINKQLRSAINKFFNGLEEYTPLNTDVDAKTEFDQINTSRTMYLDIIDRIVHNNNYEVYFLNLLNDWRSQSGEKAWK